MELNDLTYEIIGCAYTVHSELGPGMLESTYEVCLEYELLKRGLSVKTQKDLPVVYKTIRLNAGYRIDMLVNDQVILELKAVSMIMPVNKAQLMTYLKLSNKKVGLLLNFNVEDMKKGIHRIIM